MMMMIVSDEMDPIVWTRILNLQPLWRDVRASKQFSLKKQRGGGLEKDKDNLEIRRMIVVMKRRKRTKTKTKTKTGRCKGK